jgi:uncharacterized membrane protein
MTDDLPPIEEMYGEKLEILEVNVDTEQGMALYQAFLVVYQIPEDRLGVPALFVGDSLLVGSAEIPKQFPDILKQGLAAGGIDWPVVPELDPFLANRPEAGATELTLAEKFSRDYIGNSLAVIVLASMIASLIVVLLGFTRPNAFRLTLGPDWIVPLLAVIGLGVASYMAYVELAHAQAVCGPVGDCNTVQQSPYAYLFGVLPIGVLGIGGFLLILTTWVAVHLSSGKTRIFTTLALFGIATIGLLFSTYLTFLEPFVIGATCAWCLSVAILMTLIFWASTMIFWKARKRGFLPLQERL